MKRPNAECFVIDDEDTMEATDKKAFMKLTREPSIKSSASIKVNETKDAECKEHGDGSNYEVGVEVAGDNNTTVYTSTISINDADHIPISLDSDEDSSLRRATEADIDPNKLPIQFDNTTNNTGIYQSINSVPDDTERAEAPATKFLDSNLDTNNLSHNIIISDDLSNNNLLYNISIHPEISHPTVPSSDPNNTLTASNEAINVLENDKIQIAPEVCTIVSSISAESVASDVGYDNMYSSGQILGYQDDFLQEFPQLPCENVSHPILQVVSDESDVEIVGDNAADIISDNVMYINSDTPTIHQTTNSDEPITIMTPDSTIEDKSECQIAEDKVNTYSVTNNVESTTIGTKIESVQNLNAIDNATIIGMADSTDENFMVETMDTKNIVMLDSGLVKPAWLRSGCFQGKSWKQVADMLGEIVTHSTLESENLSILRQIITNLNRQNGPTNIEELRTQIKMLLR
ncbi:hypothetical protein BMR1_01G01175 [Babesia microti strain RI]|uniref:Uncharacterized protein n=1 Tax=Babesia microti (strain RI) TaxID=1133968 RepID=I7IFD2_BABMR|nr:hypothetical protein BMR1_01G01175 [Babesia microti strain RI]CCF72701.1 hypothetical protein BMR1_01G01175 [Babesia microti strain RI]|eukprot:XP_012647310.1 hypothetical protein BMR1_01G01175 [Babesia microti strain RI]